MAEINVQDSQVSVIPETQQDEEQLDSEIATIRAQIKSLTHRHSILTASLLTSPSTLPLLTQHSPTSSTELSEPTLLSRSASQTTHDLSRLHRLCTGATTFLVHDPDPHAPSNPLLGIRIEAYSPRDRTFHAPSYLLLSRPYADSARCRVHRHTIPAHIPLRALVAKYLPPPPPRAAGGVAKGGREQDLVGLVREVRREVVGGERRRGAVERVREAVLGAGSGVRDVRVTDMEGRDVRIEWRDGGVGRVRVGKDGRIEKVVVLGERGRAREMERKLGGGDGRVEGLAERMREMEGLL